MNATQGLYLGVAMGLLVTQCLLRGVDWQLFLDTSPVKSSCRGC